MKWFVDCAQKCGIFISPEMLEQFYLYEEILLEWNRKMNLTAITERDDIFLKHFLDSILPLHLTSFGEGISLLDVGAGAGFPGLPLKILRPDFSLTLLDSLHKRTLFLKEVSEKLGLLSSIVHGRAEEFGRKDNFREKFDVVIARAVAPLSVLAEYCIPFVEIGGRFLAMKGIMQGEELAAGRSAIERLGCSIGELMDYALPNGDKRTLLVCEKLSHTSTQYPRNNKKIQKQLEN